MQISCRFEQLPFKTFKYQMQQLHTNIPPKSGSKVDNLFLICLNWSPDFNKLLQIKVR